MSREEFSEGAKLAIGLKAMFFCTNPDCSRLTAYETSNKKTKKVGEAAHIEAASEDGPRAIDKWISTARLTKPENGIWLCRICHKKIDDDESSYSVDMLREWKIQHFDMMSKLVGLDIEAVMIRLIQLRKSTNKYEAQKFLNWLTSRRSLVYSEGEERPFLVLNFVGELRAKIRDAKTNIDSVSAHEFYDLLESIEVAAIHFSNMNDKINLEKLTPCSSDLAWNNFCAALKHFREEVNIPIKNFANKHTLKLDWLLQDS